MKQAKTMMMLVTRWLIVLAICFFVVPGHVFAERPAASKQSMCSASCAARCPCCISKAPASVPTVPLAPGSSARTVVAKDVPPASVLNALLLQEHADEAFVPSEFSIGHFPASLPVFLRHRTILI